MSFKERTPFEVPRLLGGVYSLVEGSSALEVNLRAQVSRLTEMQSSGYLNAAARRDLRGASCSYGGGP